MDIKVVSEDNAVELSRVIDVPTIILSIKQPHYKKVEFVENPYIKDIFRMSFYDLDIGESYHEGLSAPRARNFKGLKKFIDKYKDEVGLVIVECPGGISRSAGLGAAVIEYLGINKNIWKERFYFPNMLVYKLSCETLGIYHTLEEFDKVYMLRKHYSMFSENELELYYKRFRKRFEKGKKVQ